MKYKVKNNFGKTLFKGGERDLIEFTKKHIQKYYEDSNYSVIGISDAIEFINDISLDLNLEYQFILGLNKSLWKEYYNCSFANVQTNTWYSIYAESKEIALEKVENKFLKDKRKQWGISKKDINNFLDDYAQEHFAMKMDVLEVFMYDHISIIYEGVGYFVSKSILHCDNDVYDFLKTYYHE